MAQFKNKKQNKTKKQKQKKTKWLFTRCLIWNVLGWFLCAQVTSHLKCIRLVAVCSSPPYINIGVRIEQTKNKIIFEHNERKLLGKLVIINKSSWKLSFLEVKPRV